RYLKHSILIRCICAGDRKENLLSDNLNLYVQFFEMISSEPNIIAEPDFLSWLTEQQLMLPLNLGWKLYQAKAHLINRKYETYETE
ncbi:MAG: hypothetical protein K2L86_07445, partial [Lachnospiraceae bacterium]|nr:hypothetical protein [Lachnospiraceae bacterium]